MLFKAGNSTSDGFFSKTFGEKFVSEFLLAMGTAGEQTIGVVEGSKGEIVDCPPTEGAGGLSDFVASVQSTKSDERLHMLVSDKSKRLSARVQDAQRDISWAIRR